MRRSLTCLFLVLASSFALSAPSAATCGGGGGGGTGGFPSGGGMVPGSPGFSYQVPWKVLIGDTKLEPSALTLYWFPTTPEQARRSTLQTSRYLTESAARCVNMALVPAEEKDLHAKYSVTAESVVLIDRDGKELGRTASAGETKWLSSGDAEKLLSAEVKKHEVWLDDQLDAAKAKEKASDNDGAVALYNQVWAERCFASSAAKKAAKALKKLGKPVAEDQAKQLDTPLPNLTEPTNTKIIQALDAGLTAEREDRYEAAREHYLEARRLDPNDMVAVRYLAELYRHHTGEWDQAKALFEQVLSRPADPLTRAVALHGLGKMTIHGGDSLKGLSYFEASIATYPLALTYRNLAVFWNSEGKHDKAKAYVDLALQADPNEPFNQIFAATYLVEDGKVAEALRVAQENHSMMAASYNLAAIYSLAGDREKAIELLSRHFYQYERYDAVRSREMKEAREDVVFKSLRADPAFVALTAEAAPPMGNMPVGDNPVLPKVGGR